MKRKLKWAAVFLALLLLGFGVALFLLPRDWITLATWKDIRVGMKVKEVEGLLGKPGMPFKELCEQWRDHLSKVLVIEGKALAEEPRSRFWGNEETFHWLGRRGIIEIQFDQRGQVRGKIFWGISPAEPSFLDCLRDWLGL